jgi:HSP20 family molecular chaperone IbpA
MSTMTTSKVTLWSRPAWDTDRWLRDFFGPATVTDRVTPTPVGLNPAAEVVHDGDDAVVRLELPGVDVEKDVTVEVDRGRLVVHGERRDRFAQEDGGKKEGRGAQRTVREIRYGSFRRSFTLPAHVTGEAITAAYDAGVLTIRVSGAHKDPAENQAQRIEITR